MDEERTFLILLLSSLFFVKDTRELKRNRDITGLSDRWRVSVLNTVRVSCWGVAENDSYACNSVIIQMYPPPLSFPVSMDGRQ